MAASLLAGVFVVKNSVVAFVPGEYFVPLIVGAVVATIGVVIINALYDFIFYKKINSNK